MGINENGNILLSVLNVCFCFQQAPSWKTDIFQEAFGAMNCMGKSPPTVAGSPGHKQRRVGDYLLFKQIAGPVWPRLLRPLNFAPLQMFKSPTEGIAVLLRNKQLLGQNSPWIPGWTANGHAEPWLPIGRRTCSASSGEMMHGWFGRLRGSRAINSNKVVGNYLMCVRSLLSIQIVANICCCRRSQEIHISLRQKPDRNHQRWQG